MRCSNGATAIGSARDGNIAALVTGYLKGESILDAALAKAGIKVDPALIAKGAEDLKKRESMR